jgi:exodeoxyribonuclease VII small subunit
MFENSENIDNQSKISLSGTYESSLAELKGVLNDIDNQETNLDDLLNNVERANQLVLHCKGKLRAIENNVTDILLVP